MRGAEYAISRGSSLDALPLELHGDGDEEDDALLAGEMSGAKEQAMEEASKHVPGAPLALPQAPCEFTDLPGLVLSTEVVVRLTRAEGILAADRRTSDCYAVAQLVVPLGSPSS